MFVRYALRTTDAPAARDFYRQALGLELPDGRSEDTSLEAWPLHERAIAAGAPAHWLGQLAVADLDVEVERWVARGARPLGPTVRSDAGAWATLADPWGAVVALRSGGDEPSDRPVRWHQLHTTAQADAWSLYGESGGWVDQGNVDAADPVGGFRLFGGDDGPVGAVANTARWEGVHAHWLFHFPVDDLDAALARVRELGGTAMEPRSLAYRRLGACEDPQGAAFGLVAG